MLVLIPSALTRGVVVSTGRRQVDDEPTENSSDEDAATDHDRGVAADEDDVGLAGEVPSDFLRQIRESMAEVSKDVLPPDYLSPISKSITSGFQLSDSLTGLFTGRLLPNIDRIGSTPGGTFFAQSESKLSAFVTGLDAQSKFQVPALARSFAENTAAIGLSPLVRALPEGLFPSDLGLGRALAMQELVATSAIADLLGRDKLLGSWRQSLLSEATARSLVGTMRVSGASEGILRDIVRTNVATARVVERFAELNKSQMFLPAVSVRPTRELRSFLDALPLTPIAGALDFASQASRGVAGLTAADLLVIDGTISDGAIDLFEDEVVEPWMSGAYTSRSVLFVRLGALNPEIADLLQGAWWQVERNGPGAVSMASHAAQEILDRTLRAVAPDDLVLRLHAADQLPKSSTYEKGGKSQPTRSGRIAAALHERNPSETKVVAAQAKALIASATFLSQSFQKGKHDSGYSVGLFRTYLVSLEALLTQLLYEPGDG